MYKNFKLDKAKYFIVFCFLLLIPIASIFAGPADTTLQGLNTTANQGFGGQGKIPFRTATPATIIGQIIGAVLAFVGILFLVLMIYGGLLWMTARGNQEQVTKAKDLIIASVIGLIIILSAYAITAYVGQALTSAS